MPVILSDRVPSSARQGFRRQAGELTGRRIEQDAPGTSLHAPGKRPTDVTRRPTGVTGRPRAELEHGGGPRQLGGDATLRRSPSRPECPTSSWWSSPTSSRRRRGRTFRGCGSGCTRWRSGSGCRGLAAGAAADGRGRLDQHRGGRAGGRGPVAPRRDVVGGVPPGPGSRRPLRVAQRLRGARRRLPGCRRVAGRGAQESFWHVPLWPFASTPSSC